MLNAAGAVGQAAVGGLRKPHTFTLCSSKVNAHMCSSFLFTWFEIHAFPPRPVGVALPQGTCQVILGISSGLRIGRQWNTAYLRLRWGIPGFEKT